MVEKRSRQRINCLSQCLLEYQNTLYRCLLKNISLTGAYIEMIDPITEKIHAGEKCCLTVDHDPVLKPVEFQIRVARTDSGHIGIEFLERMANA